jgi:hypothetical protein
MGDVVPTRIFLEALVNRACGQFFQDRVTQTSPPLWLRIIGEDRLLKLPFQPVELGVERLVTRHQSMLRMPMIASPFATLAEQAIREKKNHVGYPEALLGSRGLDRKLIRTLASSEWVHEHQNVLLIGPSGLARGGRRVSE